MSQQLQCEITPSREDNFLHASFTLNHADFKQARFILVLLTGYNGDSCPLAEDPQWSAFAEKQQALIVTATFRSEGGKIDPTYHYAAAQHGSGAALETALLQFSEELSCPSINTLPLLIHGFSAGGQFAYGFSCYKPQRLIGFSSGKGGFYFPEPVTETYNVPGIIYSGSQDLQRRRDGIRQLFENHRRHGAAWTWLEDNCGHELAETINVVISFFNAILELRLNNGAIQNIAEPLKKFARLDNHAYANSDYQPAESLAFMPNKDFHTLWSTRDNAADKFITNKFT